MNNMSSTTDADDVCALCGIAGGDNIKLKRCTACKLVQYCSVTCQKEHRPEHKRACKRRAREIREEILFRQPESSHLGDCPICFIPHSLDMDMEKVTQYACCSKIVCNGCVYANELREEEESLESSCPFCRAPPPQTDREINQCHMKRIEANDPFALCQMGLKSDHEQDYRSAFKYWARAAQLGDALAHYHLGLLYLRGRGVELDMQKATHHWEEAAIGGEPAARYNLGVREGKLRRNQRAAKHLIIAANMGHDDSIATLRDCVRAGWVRKEDYAAALRQYQDAVDATKSPQREKAEAEYSPRDPIAYIPFDT